MDPRNATIGKAKRFLPRLRAHLIALVLAVLLPALTVAAGAAWHLADNYRRTFEARLQDTARAMALFLDSEVQTHLATVVALASSPLLERDDLAAFDAWARSVGQSVGSWVVLNDAAPGHRQLLNTALPEGEPLPPPSPPGEGAWDVIRRAVETGRPAVSDFFVGRGTRRPIVAVAAPALQAARVTRVVVLVIDPGRLSARLTAMGPSGGAFVSVADGGGRIVARSRDHERFAGTIPPSRSVPEAERARGVFWSQSVYGEPALYSAQPLQTAPGWSVVVAEPYARYRANWLGPLAVLATGAAVVMALGLAVAAGLARRILRPVAALVRRAEAIAADEPGRGMPPPTVPPAGVAEFEALRLASEQAEHSLAAREAEFRAIFDTAAAGVVEVDARTRLYLRANRRFCAIVGRSEADLVGRLGPDDICHPTDRGQAAAFLAITQGGEPEGEYRLLRPDGAVVWVQANAAISARDPQGRTLRAVSIVQDVTERRRAEEVRELLTREVDHRAKNALAVVQAALRLTPKDDAAAYASAVEGRVAALARAHTLLAEARWSGADLRTLAQAEMGAFLLGATLDGPAVTLLPAAAQAFSMALHELATNATKHGALSVLGGRVRLAWSLDSEAGLLRLRWSEHNGPLIQAPPERRGFGSRVIEATIRNQLGGSVTKSWQPTGLVCQLDVPLARAVADEAAPTTSDTNTEPERHGWPLIPASLPAKSDVDTRLT
ncbi:PAS domain S-box protein [Dankookia rubra]|uniref:histidine kinase n=1 Tax=Dankookia rubra TaxID=1442381 RepID=A0A4R5Q778_9PROT|nr:HWE histidine kinase domain-containing protein [Dankookia rubra]TDH58413.1 PAS domain S-box protein [Dankookia rubra]